MQINFEEKIKKIVFKIFSHLNRTLYFATPPQMQNPLRVGFIGLGNMGRPMAANLYAKHPNLHLFVYNRTPAKAHEFLAQYGDNNKNKISVCSSVAEVAQECQIVLSCLTDVASSQEVFVGEEGLCKHAAGGQIFVDHSTVDLKTTKR